MLEWIKENKIVSILIILAVSVIILVVHSAISEMLDDEEIVVEGTIIKVEYLGESDYYYDGETFKITFDNGNSYVVECREDTDFTVNSKMIVKLWRTNPDSNWEIKRIYKVPENP